MIAKKMSKTFWAAGMAVGVLVGAVGCGGDEEDTVAGDGTNVPAVPTTPSVTIDAIPTITGPGTTPVSGTLTLLGGETATAMVLQDGMPGVATGITATIAAPTEVKDTYALSDDLGLQITVSEEACNGPYALMVSFGDTSNSAAFTVTGAKNCNLSWTEDITLGSWANSTYGSSLDADILSVFTVGMVENMGIEENIDAWFSNTAPPDMGGVPALYSPKAAAGDLHPPKDWAVQNETLFMPLSAGSIDALTTQEDLAALWDPNLAVQELEINAGDYVLIQTNLGSYRALEIKSAQNTNDGIAVVLGMTFTMPGS